MPAKKSAERTPSQSAFLPPFAPQILSQLEAAGYLTKTRVGRRNHYTVHSELPLRHPLNNGRQVGELLRVIEPEIPLRT